MRTASDKLSKGGWGRGGGNSLSTAVQITTKQQITTNRGGPAGQPSIRRTILDERRASDAACAWKCFVCGVLFSAEADEQAATLSFSVASSLPGRPLP